MKIEGYLRKNQTPFRERLMDGGVSDIHEGRGKLNALENHPNKIIRIEGFHQLKERYKNKIEVYELVRIAKKLYEELETKYNIPTPVRFFIGKDATGKEVVYSVVDKIEGTNLGNVERSSEVAAQTEILYTSIAKYFFDKLQEGGYYLTDINSPRQYVYGRKSGEQEDKIYLVDTDVYLDNSQIGIYQTVDWLMRHLSGMEEDMNKRFDAAREYLTQFVNQPVSDKVRERVKTNINNVKNFLGNQEFGPGPRPAIPPFGQSV